MRIPRLTPCLLALVCTLAGCTQTGGFRSASAGNTNPNIRTIASVGDKPIPIVTGEPGLSVRPETDEIDLPPPSGARISGRVYDDRGRPVPNAKVRLAAGSAPSGKASYATTDRSGAFTLHGLRSGTYYTVIAEYDGQRGAMSGRMEARAPDTNVRISLHTGESEADEAHSTIRPAKSRVEAGSDDDQAENDGFSVRSRADRYNSEDMEPPAAEATSLAPSSRRTASRFASDDNGPPIRAGWNPQRRPLANASDSGSRDRGESDEPGPVRSSAESASEDDDDGPNPLPPAHEQRKVGSTSPGDADYGPSLKIAQDRTRSSPPASRQTGAVALAPDEARSGVSRGQSSDRKPRAMPDGGVSNPGEMRPDSFAPIRAADPSESDNPPSAAQPRARRRTTAPSANTRSSRSSDTSDDEPADDSRTNNDSAARAPSTATSLAGAAGPAVVRRRPTWRDVPLDTPDVPVDRSVQLAAATSAVTEPKVVTLTSKSASTSTSTSTTAPARRGLFQRLGGSKRPIAAAPEPGQSLCRVDPTDRRLVELQLPGLDGKIVSLKDMDADLVLIDFWGSWCRECRRSIPHLTELQARYGEQRLRVIGVACERGGSQEDRQASAAKAARDLKINYPVLVSTMDGTCAVQKGMQIQFYPTMVLLDRNGRVIKREQGATDATLARIDRAIDAALR